MAPSGGRTVDPARKLGRLAALGDRPHRGPDLPRALLRTLLLTAAIALTVKIKHFYLSA